MECHNRTYTRETFVIQIFTIGRSRIHLACSDHVTRLQLTPFFEWCSIDDGSRIRFMIIQAGGFLDIFLSLLSYAASRHICTFLLVPVFLPCFSFEAFRLRSGFLYLCTAMKENKKVAVVTGANRGIGLEIAKKLAQKGFHVFLTCRRLSEGQAAANGLKGEVSVVEMDVTSSKSIKNAVAVIGGMVPAVDVLVNNAGVSKGPSGVMDTPMSEVREVMNVNFFGAMRTAKFFYPLLSESDDARIINISSGMGAMSDLSGSHAAYRLSKASMNALTIMLSRELVHIVKVFAMCPGWVRTAMGGKSAIRTVAEGAETAVWLATDENARTGKFYRDKKEIEW